MEKVQQKEGKQQKKNICLPVKRSANWMYYKRGMNGLSPSVFCWDLIALLLSASRCRAVTHTQNPGISLKTCRLLPALRMKRRWGWRGAEEKFIRGANRAKNSPNKPKHKKSSRSGSQSVHATSTPRLLRGSDGTLECPSAAAATLRCRPIGALRVSWTHHCLMGGPTERSIIKTYKNSCHFFPLSLFSYKIL